MAIGTNSAVNFFGTQDTLGTSSSSVANDAFSVAADLSTFTNDDDAPQASITILCDFSVAPTANTALNLYARMLNVESTNDGTVPDANFQHKYLGSFPLNDSTAAQYIYLLMWAYQTVKRLKNMSFMLKINLGSRYPLDGIYM